MDKRSTIGCDPEFFLRKGDKLVSAIGIIPGTKEEPHRLPSGSGMQVDNVALEFASDVAVNGEDLVKKIGDTFKEIFSVIPKDHDIEVTPSAIFDADQLEHPEAKRFGCSPDYCAWELETNNPPVPANEQFRSCGGHIHVGKVEGDGNDFLNEDMGKVEMIRTMDLLHGTISTILDNSLAAIERRTLYGKAGCHRPTSYGVEYRVLSNYWMKSPHLVMLMDSLTQDALRLVREGMHEELIDAVGSDELRNIINEGKVEEAKKVLDVYILAVLSQDSKFYLEECMANIEKYDFKKEWSLEARA